MDLLLLIAGVFGVLFLLDRGLTSLTRRRQSGNEVRLPKRYGSMALALVVLGAAAALLPLFGGPPTLLLGGIVVVPCGVVLAIYFMTHGISYDDDGFRYTKFGSRSVAYRYADITAQKLYALQGGSHLVELYMVGGRTVPVETAMENALPFLDQAARARLRQLGLKEQDCPWFDPANACWFPSEEE